MAWPRLNAGVGPHHFRSDWMKHPRIKTYVAGVGLALMLWSWAAVVSGDSYTPVASALAYGVTVLAGLPLYAVRFIPASIPLVPVTSAFVFALIGFPALWLVLFLAARLSYAAVVNMYWSENWTMAVEVWAVISMLPYLPIFNAVSMGTVAYVTALIAVGSTHRVVSVAAWCITVLFTSLFGLFYAAQIDEELGFL